MLGIGLTVSSGALVYSLEESIRAKMGSRIAIEGGKMESPGCTVSFLQSGITEQKADRNAVRDLGRRVERENGFFESNSCTLTEVTSLQATYGFESRTIKKFQDRVKSFGGSIESIEAAYSDLDDLT